MFGLVYVDLPTTMSLAKSWLELWWILHRGGGAAEMAGVADQVDVHIGTLSKAVGSQGGFVACSRNVKSLLLNRGRPYVYSTALPLPTVAAASAAIRVSGAVRPSLPSLLQLPMNLFASSHGHSFYLLQIRIHARIKCLPAMIR